MTAPGTKDLILYDATNKLRLEHHTVTTRSGGVHLDAGLIVESALATIRTYIPEHVAIFIEHDSDKHGVTIHSTSEAPLDVSILLIGNA